MPINNPHFESLIAAKRAYDDHVDAVRAKYGYQCTDDQLTSGEIIDQTLTTAEYLECVNLFLGYYQGCVV